jgi:hypothetical protein
MQVHVDLADAWPSPHKAWPCSAASPCSCVLFVKTAAVLPDPRKCVPLLAMCSDESTVLLMLCTAMFGMSVPHSSYSCWPQVHGQAGAC